MSAEVGRTARRVGDACVLVMPPVLPSVQMGVTQTAAAAAAPTGAAGVARAGAAGAGGAAGAVGEVSWWRRRERMNLR